MKKQKIPNKCDKPAHEQKEQADGGSEGSCKCYIHHDKIQHSTRHLDNTHSNIPDNKVPHFHPWGSVGLKPRRIVRELLSKM